MKVPFLDLVNIHRDIEPQLEEVYRHCIRTGNYVGGKMVADFEQQFATYVGTKYCVALNSGTDALRLGLLAMGLKPGDGVITVANTFIATTEAITQAGGKIEFVDVCRETSLLDTKKLETWLFERRQNGDARPMPRFILPVHLYGQSVEMERLNVLAEKYGLTVIEDCAQAHGALHNGKMVGSFGKAAAFSFYPGKNLGALGEGGAITTDDPIVAEKVKMLREHGQREKYIHSCEGYNSRMHAMQAGFLSVKLPLLEGWNAERRKISQAYDDAFGGQSWIQTVKVNSSNVPARHLYVIHVENRKALAHYLNQKGIATGLHYPKALHKQDCYRNESFAQVTLPETEYLADRLMSLPLFPGMTSIEQSYVIESVLSAKDAL
jgi:dTDP-4-amino-4,6-dideoxygalactose transaminase